MLRMFRQRMGPASMPRKRFANLGVGVVLTGNVGPNAFRTLQAAGIRIVLFDKDRKTVEDVLQGWKTGDFSEATKATVKGHRV